MTQDALPVYVQIANDLRHSIEAAIYAVGDRLPTEAELSQQFAVNRHTLRRAVELLRQEGLVRVDRGRGTFVAAAPITLSIGQRVRYNDLLKAQGITPTKQTLRIVELSASGTVAQRLGLEEGDRVTLFERLSLADGAPLSIASSYFPEQRLPGILEYCQQYQSVSAMLRQEFGFDHIRRRTQLSARLVQPRDARLLQVPMQSPILLTESINVNQSEAVIEYGVTRFRGDRMELVFENQPSTTD